jgi:hypothetical protein
MNTDKQYTAFAGFDRLAAGNLETVSKQIRDHAGGAAHVLVFDNETGKQVDVDLRGYPDEAPAGAELPLRKKGPGRPRLGVVCREVSLLPRHWEWLERQPQKASGTLRRLVEAARKNDRGETRCRETIEATDRFMWSIAGNLAGFEEAGRALYTRNWSKFDEIVASWPRDIKAHLSLMLRPIRDAGSVSGQQERD